MNFLAPFGWLYGWIVDLRNWMYDRGWLNSYSLDARTISVGNITTGGTGKTPLVALVAELLADNGEKVCILTRGYGRENAAARVLVSDGERTLVDANTGGDEPVELAQKLLGKAIVIADADRVPTAKWAKEKFGITAFVLDDGFQHRRAKRDLDIVCIDATDPFGNRFVLPAGRLREPLRNLKRADAIVITRTNLVKDIDDLKSEISNLRSEMFRAETRITGFIPIEEFHAKSRSPQSSDPTPWFALLKHKKPSDDNEVRIAAFCGLGNPNGFFRNLREANDPLDQVDVTILRKFPDHHPYRQADVDDLEKQARECSVDVLITTAKDAVKLSDLKFEIPCYVAIAETVIDDAEAFRKLIISS